MPCRERIVKREWQPVNPFWITLVRSNWIGERGRWDVLCGIANYYRHPMESTATFPTSLSIWCYLTTKYKDLFQPTWNWRDWRWESTVPICQIKEEIQFKCQCCLADITSHDECYSWHITYLFSLLIVPFYGYEYYHNLAQLISRRDCIVQLHIPTYYAFNIVCVILSLQLLTRLALIPNNNASKFQLTKH